jgi:hypothetical protein
MSDIPTNTYTTLTTGASRNNKEDLSNEIYMISPVDSMISGKIRKVKATGTKHEHQIQTLAAGTDDYNYEGDDTAAEALTPTTRPYNTCQIQKKVFRISGTEEVVKKGGAMQSEIDRQTALKLKEHSKNIEVMTVSGIRQDTDPRRSRGIANWCTTNLGKADDAVLNADGTITAGTARPLTEQLVKDQLQNTYTQGGAVDTIYGGTFQKQQISDFVNDGSNRTRNVDKKTLINSIDVYDSDFGLVAVKAHRNMPTSILLGLDHNYWAMATLRKTFREALAKSGDSHPFHIITEHCVEACNEASSFRISDLTTSA